MKEIKLPEVSLILLVGPSSAGKSTFARKYFLPTEIVSSDYCRALISDDENNLAVTTDAFDVLNYIVSKRLRLGKLTVVDALNLRKEDRAKLIQLAKNNYALACAIVLDASMREIVDRHALRTDRTFGNSVLEKQYDNYKKSKRSIEKEGFSYVYQVNPSEEIFITRQKLRNNKTDIQGSFDIIGDIHGCFDELIELMNKLDYQIELQATGNFSVSHPLNRKILFLGDLTDRGEKSPDVLRLVIDMVNAGNAYCISGNHDDRLNKFLRRKNIPLNHGLDITVRQLEQVSPEFKMEIKNFLYELTAHYVFDGGRLVIAHGGLPEEMHGRASSIVRAFCLYGETNGEIDEFGLPVRHNWAKNYNGKAMVVYGHTPVPKAEWLNNTINIDTGCVFGGQLTALRYPEREIVSVPAKKVYFEPVKPLVTENESLLHDKYYDDLLNIDIINGKKIIETNYHSKIVIQEENAITALEIMSRFATNPKWLIYLPPTMSPPETSKREDYLEHPEEVFQYYRKNGISEVLCEEKHMGSRAIAVICKTPEVAVERFGLTKTSLGLIYTRTGRRFFNDPETENQFLEVFNQALSETGFWDKFQTDWVCFDGEIMPWSAKAKELIMKQYSSVGSSGINAFKHSIDALITAGNRGIDTAQLTEKYQNRKMQMQMYVNSYRNYCRETNGIEGVQYAPFHILATEGKTYFDKTHPWHLENLKTLSEVNPNHFIATRNIRVDLQDTESIDSAIQWWTDLTSRGGEGMVVKPLDYIATNKNRIIQPAMKCRGSEYLRIIYGPEYNTHNNINILKERNVKYKRNLAIQEFILGLESLSRFIKKEPLRNVHECVFGVLALEAEPVDPTL